MFPNKRLTSLQTLSFYVVIKMKPSVLLAATTGVMASAGPLHKRQHVVTDVVVAYHTVTVTGGGQPASTPEPTPAPEPEAPATSEAPVVVVKTTVKADAPKAEPTVAAASPVAQAPAKAPAADPPKASPSDMPSVAVAAHNRHRSNHSAPAVEWLDEIAGYAANTAATCKFAHDMYVFCLPA